MSKAPIAFFAYNRPWHAEKSLESLSQCEGAKESALYIFCDGTKREEDVRAVEEVRKLVRSYEWCGSVNIIERDKNIGLASSIISGVTELCNKYGRVIVLEDDLVLSPQFLNYMNDALEIYKNIPKVMHISGYMFPVNDRLPETFFYRSASCWGWATWARAWEKLALDADNLLLQLKNTNLRYEFDIKGSNDFYDTLVDNATGKIKTWAIYWYASVFLAGGLCLHPGESLVNNIGHDNTGTNCSKTNVFNVEVRKHRITRFTQDIKENESVLEMMADYYRRINKRSLFVRVLSGIKRVTRRILK